MIINDLYIFLQGLYLYIGNLRQPLDLDNNFFIYKWKADSIPYALYTDDELRRIHRGFGHPSIRSTHIFLKRTNPENLQANVIHNSRSSPKTAIYVPRTHHHHVVSS